MTNGSSHKPQADVYTLMLLLALLAIIGATVFLYLETSDYGATPFQGAPSASIAHDGPVLVATALPTLKTAVGVCRGDGSIHT